MWIVTLWNSKSYTSYKFTNVWAADLLLTYQNNFSSYRLLTRWEEDMVECLCYRLENHEDKAKYIVHQHQEWIQLQKHDCYRPIKLTAREEHACIKLVIQHWYHIPNSELDFPIKFSSRICLCDSGSYENNFLGSHWWKLILRFLNNFEFNFTSHLTIAAIVSCIVKQQVIVPFS